MPLIILATPDVKIEQSMIEMSLGTVKLLENGETISGEVFALNEEAKVNLKGDFWIFDHYGASQWEKVCF